MLIDFMCLTILVFLPLLLTIEHFIRGQALQVTGLWDALIEGPVEVGQVLSNWRRPEPHQEGLWTSCSGMWILPLR